MFVLMSLNADILFVKTSIYSPKTRDLSNMLDLKMEMDVFVEIVKTNLFQLMKTNAMFHALAIQVNSVVARGV